MPFVGSTFQRLATERYAVFSLSTNCLVLDSHICINFVDFHLLLHATVTKKEKCSVDGKQFFGHCRSSKELRSYQFGTKVYRTYVGMEGGTGFQTLSACCPLCVIVINHFPLLLTTTPKLFSSTQIKQRRKGRQDLITIICSRRREITIIINRNARNNNNFQ